MQGDDVTRPKTPETKSRDAWISGIKARLCTAGTCHGYFVPRLVLPLRNEARLAGQRSGFGRCLRRSWRGRPESGSVRVEARGLITRNHYFVPVYPMPIFGTLMGHSLATTGKFAQQLTTRIIAQQSDFQAVLCCCFTVSTVPKRTGNQKVAPPESYFNFSRKGVSRSMGSGKMMVVFLSAPMTVSVSR